MPARVILLLLACVCPTGAGVVSRDLFEPGDGLLTYDDVNQREWLDFSVTQELFDSSNPASVTLPARLSGFRLASLEEVEALMLSASVPQVEAWSVPGGAPGTADLIELMGVSGQFSGSILGTMQFAGGYVAIDAAAPPTPDTTVAVLAFNFGVETIPGALNRPATARSSNGHYRLTLADYSFGQGPIDLDFTTGIQTSDSNTAPVGDGRMADDLDGNGNSGFTRVIGPNGEVIAMVNDFGDLHQFDIFFDYIQGYPAYWLYRDASPVPEPAGLCLAVAACLAALRLRALA